jgi:hypothetical protein
LKNSGLREKIDMGKIILKPTFHSLIYEFRGIKVMLDFDLAILYGVETKRLKQQVNRNRSRFPEDFMFELNKEEIDRLRLHFATSKRGGTRYPPMVFTEQGVAMLSTVLNTEKAIQVNIEIMRAFARYRAIILENVDFKTELKSLDEKIDQIFRYLLEKIDALSKKESKTIINKRIGYKRYDEE